MGLSVVKRFGNQSLKRPRYYKGLLVLGIIAVGIVLGMVMLTPSRGLVASLVATTIYAVVIAANPLHGLLLWIVTQPLADLYSNISLGAGIPDISPTRFCLGFITVLVLARTAVGRKQLARFTKIDAVAMFFLFGMILAVPEGRYGWQSLQDVFDRFIVPVLVYMLAKNLVQDRGQLDRVVFSVLVLATYVGLYAIYEQITGNILFVVRENAAVAYGQSGLRALRGLFGHPHPFGRVLGIAIPFCFYRVLEEKRARRRAIYLLTLVIMFVGLYLTYRRAAWIAAMASLFLIQLFYPRFRKVFIVLLVVTSAAVYLNRDRLDDSAVSNRVQAGDTSTLNGRTEGWEFAIELWKRRPITGYGYDQFGTLARQEGQRDTAIESQYLSVLVSSGLAGFLPYVLLLIMIPLSFVKAFRDRDGPIDKRLIVMYWGAHLSYLVNAYTATVGGVVTTSMLFLLAGALGGVIAQSTTADGRIWSVSGAVQP